MLKEVQKFLLVGINSKFNHVNLAIKSLEKYTKTYSTNYPKKFSLDVINFTINQPILEILSNILLTKPNALFFSVYIWNVEIVKKLIVEIKKILPECFIGLGGPEVSYNCESVLTNHPQVNAIMIGEGEKTFLSLCDTLCAKPINSLDKVNGLVFLQNKSIHYTSQQNLIQNLDEIPFPYENSQGNLVSDIHPDNSIIYYESSRGCPFHCSYCLSSIDKSVRFYSLERVTKDLQFFLDNNVRLVKFVDRTYNLNEQRYIAIWKFILQNWNHKTTFHFEISAEQLTDNALNVISTVPIGCMQFEIGIQSTNPTTLNQIGRPADLARIEYVLSKIPKTIHVHLDLIAGLPYESLLEFASSFNFTINQQPLMLQLGFLKILHGTTMENYAKTFPEYKYLSVPPYEVLCSPWMTYEDIQKLKQIDNLVDNYYNSQNFTQIFVFLFSQKIDFYLFFSTLSEYFETNNYFSLLHKSIFYYQAFYDFLLTTNIFTSNQIKVLLELLRFDFIKTEKPGTYPEWYNRHYNKDKHRNALEANYVFKSTKEAYNNSSFEEFSINPFSFEILPGNIYCSVLFIYNDKNITQSNLKTAIKSGNSNCFLIEQ